MGSPPRRPLRPGRGRAGPGPGASAAAPRRPRAGAPRAPARSRPRRVSSTIVAQLRVGAGEGADGHLADGFGGDAPDPDGEQRAELRIAPRSCEHLDAAGPVGRDAHPGRARLGPRTTSANASRTSCGPRRSRRTPPASVLWTTEAAWTLRTTGKPRRSAAATASRAVPRAPRAGPPTPKWASRRAASSSARARGEARACANAAARPAGRDGEACAEEAPVAATARTARCAPVRPGQGPRAAQGHVGGSEEGKALRAQRSRRPAAPRRRRGRGGARACPFAGGARERKPAVGPS